MRKNEMVEIKGTFLRYRYKNPDFAVMLIDMVSCRNHGEADLLDNDTMAKGTVTAVGAIPDYVLLEGTAISVVGSWALHPKFGRQLKIEMMTVSEPTESHGIEAYLSSGIVRGIGAAMARKLVKEFGDNTINILDSNPEKIMQISGIGAIKADKIIKSWKEQRQNAELFASLCSIGLSITIARKAIRSYGVKAFNILQSNPYQLTEIHGVGFIKADQVARKLSIAEDSETRIIAGLLYCLQESTFTEGHCYLPVKELVKRAEKLLVLPNEIIMRTLYKKGNTLLSDSAEVNQNIAGKVVFEGNDVYLKKIYQAQCDVAGRIDSMAYKMSLLKTDEQGMAKLFENLDITLTQEQQEAVKMALFKSRISVITGLPGVGKTTTVKALIQILQRHNKSFVMAAPTGKAAKRLSEQTGVSAKTVHRLLEVQKNGLFAKNEADPITADFIIIDEVSMVDILLFDHLLRAVGDESSIILIGDPNQLPSIGPGRVLKNIIENCLCPAKELREIQRQAEGSSIIKVAHNIFYGVSPLSVPKAPDFIFMEEEDPLRIRELIISLVATNTKYSPEDIQVLTPMRRGPIGANEINTGLQQRLRTKERSESEGVRGRDNGSSVELYLNDRVIQLINNYEKEVFNGEIGYVDNINRENDELSVNFGDKKVLYEFEELDQIGLAYCLTVHKSQGSEFPCLIVPVSTQHYVMLYRNLIYTAVTRAKETLILIGTRKAISIAVKNDKQLVRYAKLSLSPAAA